jgi:hypothetical protein
MYPKKFFSSMPLQPLSKRCFVIMPFAKEFNEVYQMIKETIEVDAGFICLRGDDPLAGNLIMEDVLRGIGESEIIIADLTGRNPNVFYELGITHMVKDISKVILITQDIESVPFDLKAFRFIVYNQTIEGIRKLKADLAQAIKEVVEDTFLFEIKENERYKLPQKLPGVGNDFYGFELTPSLGFRSVKINLRVMRYGNNDSLEEVSRIAHSLGEGQSIVVPNIPWQLRLEQVAPDGTAMFCLCPVKNH